MKKLELIQAFRGIAALLVVLFHTSELIQLKFNQAFLFNIFGFGKAGVNFFFVLSGFIIFFVHHSDIGDFKKLKQFLIKRCIRVYPLYWIVTFAVLAVYFIVPSFGKGNETQFSIIIQSLLLYPQQNFPILIVGWSLSYEIFFYLLFSLAIALRPQRSLQLGIIWLLATTIFLAWSQAINSLELPVPLLINFIFSYHGLEFALGCLAAFIILKIRLKNPISLGLLGSGTILFIYFGICQTYGLTKVHPLVAYSIPSTLIILGAASLDLREYFKIHSVFNNIGDSSYSIYLIHYPILSALTKPYSTLNLENYHLLTFGIISTFITILLGYLTHTTLEKRLIVFCRTRLL